jgi:hypothetical protein
MFGQNLLTHGYMGSGEEHTSLQGNPFYF